MKHLFFILIILSTLSCKNENNVNSENAKSDLISSVTYNLEPLEDVKLFAGQLLRIDSFPSKYIVPRPVDVWLPKNYSKEKRYSVLYMHDGQMLFDSTATWNKQEWKVDEWATKLIKEHKTKDFIVVAIHNIPNIRWKDLFPQKAFSFIEKSVQDQLLEEAVNAGFNPQFNGDNYLKCLTEEIKPFIDKQYAVYADREHTFIMGSSMGGLMSMYAVSEYPEVFGGAGCISTHWVGATPKEDNPLPEAIFKYMEANLPESGTHKLYFDYGDKTLDQHYPQYAPEVDRILKLKGYTTDDSRNLFFEGTDHSENSWNQRLDKPMTFLLGKGKN
ncbi:alpha/beta hydrolase [Winogradskyella alexanderae]|uniref:Esterase n=1 Tax=Winogradskyella alexanderae TaxID=2877123 RepID=A0ABS7XS32_9FLAO|nr:alpha/beta hydrolase-fold protein [Winogradskyella alexanderae]MCA0132570.1 esterase [Winogradskyella alexanderae]